VLPAGTPLSDWLTWLETLSPTEIDLGLERVQTVLDRLSLELPEHVLLIAGTNGKGSSVAVTSALLQAAEYRVGAYTSPHVIDFNERIVIDGTPADNAVIIAAFERIERVRDVLPLTYFEFATVAAMVVFADARLDAWVLEVGLGGRLDATNAIDPTASLITNVALDHCDWLGDDIESIAAEKAGIMREGVATVYGARDVPAAVLDHAERSGARLLLAGRDFDYERDGSGLWKWTSNDKSLDDLSSPGLRGDFQYSNVAAVLALLDVAGLDRALDVALINRVLPTLSLAGRMQEFSAGGPRWLLDVAHNPAAAEELGAVLADERLDNAETWAIIGVLDDKDVAGIVTPMDPFVDHWIAVTADSPRAVPAVELGRRIGNACNRPCRIIDSLEEAMDYAGSRARERDTLLVTGSFYVVGPALRALGLYSRRES
jgi:dihydrofolate synthase/folylpolyglutamate synthase